MIPREDIDRIYNAARIEDVIGDYVTLRRRGVNLIGLCPFHDEKTGSFTVSPSKGIYKCFGCGKAGNVVNFIMEYEQVSYADALRNLAKRYHIDIHEKELTNEEKEQQNERESMFMLNDWANQWFQGQLNNTAEGQQIGLRYFIERGLTEATIKKFQLGYSPEKSALYQAAKQAGFKEEYLEKTGLCGKSEHGYYDRFRDRVIFPIHTISGKIVGFAGRILKKKDHVGKYVNSPDSAIYSKQNELYGLYLAKQQIAKMQCCYLVEGQMDVISMHQAGIENVVSSGGTALTHRQVVLLHRFTEDVTILYDGDAAGIHAALRGIDMMLEEGLRLKVVLLPDGEDPDSMSRKMNAADFIQYLKQNEQDFIHFKTKLLLKDAENDPIKKSTVTRDILQSISVIPDTVTRGIYIRNCSQMLNLKEETVIADVNKLRKQHYEDLRKIKEQQERRETGQTTITEPETPAATDSVRLESEQQTVTQTVQPTELLSLRQTNKLQKNMLNIIRVLIRFGNMPLFQNEDGSIMTVAQYIISDLQRDQIEFTIPLYKKVIDEYSEHLTEADFDPVRYFQFHSDGQLAALATSVIIDEYQLSKIYTKTSISENVKQDVKLPTDADRLVDLVPQLLYELKLTILTDQITDLRHQLKLAQDNDDFVQMQQLLETIVWYENARRQFCQALNQRYNS